MDDRGYGFRYSTIILLGLIIASQAWMSAASSNYERPEQRQPCSTVHQRELETSTRIAGKFVDRAQALADNTRSKKWLEKTKTQSTMKHSWTARLVKDHHWSQFSQGLSAMEQIRNDVAKSKARSTYISSKVQKVSEKSGTQRKLLDFGSGLASSDPYESSVHATPGGFSMDFSLGTPPRNFTAVADTGNELVWIQCARCTNCVQNASIAFDPIQSSTYGNLSCSSNTCTAIGNGKLGCTPNCRYSHTYAYGSSTGDFALDTLSIKNANGTTIQAPNFAFGCGLNNSFTSTHFGNFRGTDGVVGLGRGPLSFPTQISTSLGFANKFSYCLPGDSNISAPIAFGGAADSISGAARNYTKLLTPHNITLVPFYFANLLNISVGSIPVSINASVFSTDSVGLSGTVFDSSSPYTSLTRSVYEPVIHTFKSVMTNPIFANYTEVDMKNQTGLELCYQLSGVNVVQVPTLVFQFEGADLNLPFYNIVTFVDGEGTGQGTMCVALVEAPRGSPTANVNIIGSHQQQNFQMVFDENEKRIGWAQADCATL